MSDRSEDRDRPRQSIEGETHLAGPSLPEALRTDGLVPKVQAVAGWWQRTRIARMLARYGKRNGGLLASGMALTALLSLTAAVTLGFTVFMAVLGGNDELRESVVKTVNEVLPGLVSDGEVDGLIPIESLQASTATSVTSIIAFAVMLWSASGVIGSLATSVRSIFGVVATPQNFAIGILRNFAGVFGMGIALIATAALGVGVGMFGDWLFGTIGVNGTAGRIAIAAASMLVNFCVDAALVAFLVAVVAQVRVPRRDLWIGAFMAGIGSLVLREVGTTAVGSVKGPLLTTATTLVTLILWINLLVRIVLYICAWMANPPAPQPVRDAAEVHFHERPNFVTMSAPHTLSWAHHPVTGEVLPDSVPAKLPDTFEVDGVDVHASS